MLKAHALTRVTVLAGLVVLLALPAQAAGLTGAEILKRALNLQASVRDYTATIRVTVDLPGVKMPERTARLYYKRPDKVHLESRDVVMVPKQALVMGELGTALTKESQVVLAGQSRRDGVPYYFLKITPSRDRAVSDRLLVWVRGDRFTVERLEGFVGSQREFAVSWEHQLVAKRYWLARRLVAQVPGRRLRRHHGPPEPEESREKTGPGTVTVQFTDLKVNTGLPDSLFVESKNNAPSRAPGRTP